MEHTLKAYEPTMEHTNKRYEHELGALSARMTQMGELVVAQMESALQCGDISGLVLL